MLNRPNALSNPAAVKAATASLQALRAKLQNIQKSFDDRIPVMDEEKNASPHVLLLNENFSKGEEIISATHKLLGFTEAVAMSNTAHNNILSDFYLAKGLFLTAYLDASYYNSWGLSNIRESARHVEYSLAYRLLDIEKQLIPIFNTAKMLAPGKKEQIAMLLEEIKEAKGKLLAHFKEFSSKKLHVSKMFMAEQKCDAIVTVNRFKGAIDPDSLPRAYSEKEKQKLAKRREKVFEQLIYSDDDIATPEKAKAGLAGFNQALLKDLESERPMFTAASRKKIVKVEKEAIALDQQVQARLVAEKQAVKALRAANKAMRAKEKNKSEEKKAESPEPMSDEIKALVKSAVKRKKEMPSAVNGVYTLFGNSKSVEKKQKREASEPVRKQQKSQF